MISERSGAELQCDEFQSTPQSREGELERGWLAPGTRNPTANGGRPMARPDRAYGRGALPGGHVSGRGRARARDVVNNIGWYQLRWTRQGRPCRPWSLASWKASAYPHFPVRSLILLHSHPISFSGKKSCFPSVHDLKSEKTENTFPRKRDPQYVLYRKLSLYRNQRVCTKLNP